MSIRALALQVLQRNRARNHSATKWDHSCNSDATEVLGYRQKMVDESKSSNVSSFACSGTSTLRRDLSIEAIASDITDSADPALSAEEVEVLARMAENRKQMEKGIRPAGYDKPAYCNGCGPVWLWFAGDVIGCPWCWNRAANQPIPRPYYIRCTDCRNFKRIEHLHLGHCLKGKPEAIAGLWDSDTRNCNLFEPRPAQKQNE